MEKFEEFMVVLDNEKQEVFGITKIVEEHDYYIVNVIYSDCNVQKLYFAKVDDSDEIDIKAYKKQFTVVDKKTCLDEMINTVMGYKNGSQVLGAL